MSDATAVSLGLLILRVTIGGVMFAHGYNHVWGGGKIEGTAGWFESLGMKPGKLHAWVASVTELGAGILLIVGLAAPLASAAVMATMLVAWITNHKSNGFFIFRPGEGYEYVMTLTLTSAAMATLGAGQYSLDDAFDIDLAGSTGLLLVGGALLAAVGLLATFWRPEPKSQD